jgi:hypothetical protein
VLQRAEGALCYVQVSSTRCPLRSAVEHAAQSPRAGSEFVLDAVECCLHLRGGRQLVRARVLIACCAQFSAVFQGLTFAEHCLHIAGVVGLVLCQHRLPFMESDLPGPFRS